MRALLLGTHINQSNGYSKVMFNLMRAMAQAQPKSEFLLYGFQNTRGDKVLNGNRTFATLSNVRVLDAMATETPVQHGFGFAGIPRVVE
jgi:hypothetical protein